MEAARTSTTLVNFYQTTRRYNPEDSHFHPRRRENLKPPHTYPLSLSTCEGKSKSAIKGRNGYMLRETSFGTGVYTKIVG
jgi:hypothetical protein